MPHKWSINRFCCGCGVSMMLVVDGQRSMICHAAPNVVPISDRLSERLWAEMFRRS